MIMFKKEEKRKKHLPCFQALFLFVCLNTSSFQTWYDDRHYWTIQLDDNLDDLDLRSSSIEQESNIFYADFLSHFSIYLNEVWFAACTNWFVDTHAFFLPQFSIQGFSLEYF